jgi:GntR family transcriptional regulator
MPEYTPHYQRIIDDLKAQIDDGRLPPLSKLPSTSDLARQSGVSANTVRAAIIRLKATGVLRGHTGIGVFVAGPSVEHPD